MKTEPSVGLPSTGYVRLSHLIGPGNPLPISKSTLWKWVSEGSFPPPVKLSKRVTAWPVEVVRAFIANPNGEAK